jgi:hypothetical protein
VKADEVNTLWHILFSQNSGTSLIGYYIDLVIQERILYSILSDLKAPLQKIKSKTSRERMRVIKG